VSAERFCSRCGAPAGGHHCDRPLKVPASLDPPRFCTNCGGRLTVQIFPDGFSSRCLRCERRARSRSGAKGLYQNRVMEPRRELLGRT
jgi:hypothetical protein